MVVTAKAANGDGPGQCCFTPLNRVPGKPVLVRQLRGPHLRNVTVMEKAVQHRGDSGAVA